jgi:hypothetical protein
MNVIAARTVMPAQAGIQGFSAPAAGEGAWIPAFALIFTHIIVN